MMKNKRNVLFWIYIVKKKERNVEWWNEGNRIIMNFLKKKKET